MKLSRKHFNRMRNINLTSIFTKIPNLVWLPHYCFQKLIGNQEPNSAKPSHIFLSIVDHFEPFNGNVAFGQAKERVKTWVKNYPIMAKKFQDSEGYNPQHTWFYPPHHDLIFLKDLVNLSIQGFGEIELHLHHNRLTPFPDTSDTLRKKILNCLETYAKYGIFCQPDGSRRFAFIHGDWSLDNSRGAKICGVNDELNILIKCGCYADFTFPAPCSSQPAIVNSIYYAKDDLSKAKSYNVGKQVAVNRKPTKNELLMIPGILGLRWDSRNRTNRLRIENSNLDSTDIPTFERIDFWVRNSIAIKKFPNFRFIKLHTHGAVEGAWDSLFGKSAQAMHEHLANRYNDGKRFLLHYVTAREMYNIIKALEAGLSEYDNSWRDYTIKDYEYFL